MSLVKTVTRPFSQLTDAVFMPFKAVFVVGLCGAINAMTFHGVWWVKWVALGMGIATVVALARGFKALLVLGVVGWIGMKVYRRWGPEAKQRFDDWVAKTHPEAGILQAWVPRSTAAAGSDAGVTGQPLRH